MQIPEKMTIKEAAKLLDKSELFVRLALQKGIFPFGTALKMSSKWTYYISRIKLYEYVGIKDTDQEGDTLCKI